MKPTTTNKAKASRVELMARLGFVEDESGCYVHELLNRSFDFSATSDAGLIYRVFEAGAEVGAESAKQEIRDALGL